MSGERNLNQKLSYSDDEEEREDLITPIRQENTVKENQSEA